MKIVNKTFQRQYEAIDTYMAGIKLSGPETKSVRLCNIRLENAYIKLTENGPVLINAEISSYMFSRNNLDIRRTRNLLLTKKEIIKLKTKLQSGGNLTIVPLACYNKKKHIKLEIALVRGKKTWQVKKIEKNRDEKRRMEKEIKEYKLK